MSIRVELELNDGQFTTKILHAGESLDKFNRNVAGSNKALQGMAANGDLVFKSISKAEQGASGFLATARDLSIVLGAVGLSMGGMARRAVELGTSIVRINAEFESLQMLMKSMSATSDPIQEAANKVEFLRKTALNSPFALQTLQKAFVKLEATGTKPLEGGFQSLVDGIAAVGGSEEQLGRAALAISQMSGKGVIQMEELRQQLGESMPRAVELMARSMGISMGQLIKDISTGTVEAKSALDIFYREVDRTYGGAAQRMMTTFNGIMSQTKTLMTIRATDSSGMKEYFQEVKEQLIDVNALLNSSAGEAFANDIGFGLQSAVQWLRMGVDGVIEFRGEITRLAMFIGGAFAAKMAVALGGSFFTGLDRAKSAVGLLRTEYALLGAQATNTGRMLGMVGVFSGVVSGASAAAGALGLLDSSSAMAMSAISGLLSVAATAVGGLGAMTGAATLFGAALTAVAPWLPVIGLAIYGVAEYFDLFASKADDAWKSFEKFGAQTRKAAKEAAAPRLNELKEEMDELRAERDQAVDWLNTSRGVIQRSENRRRVEDANNRLIEKQKEFDSLMEIYQEKYDEAGSTEDEAAHQKVLARIATETAAVQFQYDQDSIALERKRDEQIKAAQGVASEEKRIYEEYAEEKKKVDLRLYDERERVLQSFLEASRTAEQSKDEGVAASARITTMELTKQINQIMQLRRATEGQGFGSPKVAKPSNVEKLGKKGDTRLDNLRQDVAKVAAELADVNEIAVEFEAQLANGDYGDMGLEQVQELRDAFIEVADEKKRLDELLEGKKKLDGDLKGALDKASNDLVAAQLKALGREATPLDEIIVRLKNGFYKGFGPGSETQQAFQGVERLLREQKAGLQNVGNTIQNDAFGDETVGRIDVVQKRLETINQIGVSIGETFNGIDLANMGNSLAGGGAGMGFMTAGQSIAVSETVKGRMAQAMQILMEEGLSKVAASGVVGNLSAESGGLTTDIKGDGGESYGMAQWHKERWTALRQFARERGTGQDDFKTQLQFLMHELKSNPSYGLAAIQGSTTPEQAAEHFMNKFERPAEWAKSKSRSHRHGSARTAFMSTSGLGPRIAEGVPGEVAAREGMLDTAAPREMQGPRQPLVKLVEFEGSMITAAQAAQVEQIRLADQKARKQEEINKLNEEEQSILNEITKVRESQGGEMSNLAALQAKIRNGDLLADDKDPASERYVKMIAAAKKLDEVEKKAATDKKSRSALDSAEEDLKRTRKAINTRIEEAAAMKSDPLQEKSSAGMRSLAKDMEEYLVAVEGVYGRDSDAYRKAAEEKKQILAQFRNTEVNEKIAGFASSNMDLKRGLMSERDARQSAMNEEIARLEAMLAADTSTGEARVQNERLVQERIAALRQQAAQNTPLGKQMVEWKNLAGNLEDATTRWTSSFADGLTGIVMGTGNLNQAMQAMSSDIINMVIKKIIAETISGKGQMASAGVGKGGGGKGKGAMSAISPRAGSKAGGGLLAGFFHSGGLIGGNPTFSRPVNPAAWAGAPRFHTGGIIKQMGLGPDEVPIVGKKGEGVFTPAQMAAMGRNAGGGGSMINIKSDITLNASGGTPEQNDDLARKTARAVENQVRVIVQQEMRSQQRASLGRK